MGLEPTAAIMTAAAVAPLAGGDAARYATMSPQFRHCEEAKDLNY